MDRADNMGILDILSSGGGGPGSGAPGMVPQQQQQYMQPPNKFRNALMAFGHGLATQGSVGPMLQGFQQQAMQQRKTQRALQQQQAKENATAKFYEKNGRDDLALMTRQGAGQMAWQIYQSENKAPDKGTAAMQNYEYGLGNPGFTQRQNELKKLGGPGNTFGPIPPGQRLAQTPDGKFYYENIPGGPADIKKKLAAEKERLTKEQRNVAGNIVLDEIDITKQLIERSPKTTTGLVGSAISGMDQTTAGQVKNRLSTIKANIGFDKLQAMRAASKTGGALGQVSEFENRLLQATFGSLEQAQDSTALLYNLERVEKIYNRIVHEGIPDDKARSMYRDVILSHGQPNQPSDDRSAIDALKQKWGRP
ncbi:MAG: hypothetical protein GY943_30615 [Chloroflexi bacterium]|nr:hypothetical protein [Chloroflexota bacterium]